MNPHPSMEANISAVKGNKENVVKGNPQQDLKNKGVIDSECSRHMTGNRSYITDYEEINEGFVAFGGNSKGGKINRKGTIRSGILDFEDVYFVKELKFNLFSVSQMCDKKSVLFTDTECVVLSPDFKLTDENHVLLKVPKKENSSVLDLKEYSSSRSLTCRKPALSFMRPFGCPVTILNTTDHLVEGITLGSEFLPLSCVFFLAPLVTRFDKSLLTIKLGRQTVALKDLGLSVCHGILEFRVVCIDRNLLHVMSNLYHLPNKSVVLDEQSKTEIRVLYKEVVDPSLEILFVNVAFLIDPCLGLYARSKQTQDPPFSFSPKDSPDAGFKPSGKEEKKDVEDPGKGSEIQSTEEPRINQEKDSMDVLMIQIYELEDIVYSYNDEDVGTEADMKNLDAFMHVSPIPTTIIHKDHPVEQIIRDMNSAPQTRRMTKNLKEHGLFSSVQQRINHKDFQNCLFACFLSQEEPKKTLVDLPNGKRAIGTKWVYRNKKDERGIVIKNKESLVAQGYTQEEGMDYDEVFAPIARIEAIRLFLAYAFFKDFMVYQMDVNSAFLYGKIKEEVYVCQPPGFEDPYFPNRRGQIDKTLFIKRDQSDILIVHVYVDDHVIFGSYTEEVIVLRRAFEKSECIRSFREFMGELSLLLRTAK
ncbi:putative ribonuclease H-like domain-containing protein [Tanacetum coccineum]